MFARELTLLFDASACLISSYDPATQAVTDWAAHVIPPATLNVVAEDYSLSEYPATLRVLTIAEVVGHVASATAAIRPSMAFLEQTGFKASMMTPLVMDGKAVGLIELFDRGPRTFTPDDIAVLPAAVPTTPASCWAPPRLAERLEEQHLATVGALAAALEAKDAYTGNHAQTIAEFAVAVGEELGLSGRELRATRMGALLHDVGKIGIPESILNKPGPLTDDEFTVMKRHTRDRRRHHLRHPRDGGGRRPGALVARALGRPRLPGRAAGHRGAARRVRDRRLRRVPRDDRGSGLPQGDVARGRGRGAAPLLRIAVHARRRGGADRGGRARPQRRVRFSEAA